MAALAFFPHPFINIAEIIRNSTAECRQHVLGCIENTSINSCAMFKDVVRYLNNVLRMLHTFTYVVHMSINFVDNWHINSRSKIHMTRHVPILAYIFRSLLLRQATSVLLADAREKRQYGQVCSNFQFVFDFCRCSTILHIHRWIVKIILFYHISSEIKKTFFTIRLTFLKLCQKNHQQVHHQCITSSIFGDEQS